MNENELELQLDRERREGQAAHIAKDRRTFEVCRHDDHDRCRVEFWNGVRWLACACDCHLGRGTV